MSSSAAHFKEKTRQAALRMTAEERVLRALALGRCDLELYASVSGMSLDEAGAALRRRRAEERSRRQRGPQR